MLGVRPDAILEQCRGSGSPAGAKEIKRVDIANIRKTVPKEIKPNNENKDPVQIPAQATGTVYTTTEVLPEQKVFTSTESGQFLEYQTQGESTVIQCYVPPEGEEEEVQGGAEYQTYTVGESQITPVTENYPSTTATITSVASVEHCYSYEIPGVGPVVVQSIRAAAPAETEHIVVQNDGPQTSEASMLPTASTSVVQVNNSATTTSTVVIQQSGDDQQSGPTEITQQSAGEECSSGAKGIDWNDSSLIQVPDTRNSEEGRKRSVVMDFDQQRVGDEVASAKPGKNKATPQTPAIVPKMELANALNLRVVNSDGNEEDLDPAVRNYEKLKSQTYAKLSEIMSFLNSSERSDQQRILLSKISEAVSGIEVPDNGTGDGTMTNIPSRASSIPKKRKKKSLPSAADLSKAKKAKKALITATPGNSSEAKSNTQEQPEQQQQPQQIVVQAENLPVQGEEILYVTTQGVATT